MFDELTKYNGSDHFFFAVNEELQDVCNAPKDGSGIYIVYELKNDCIQLVYIGSSGKVQNDGSIKCRQGGIYDRIVNGYQFGQTPRRKSWKQKLMDEKIDALDIYWYETFNSEHRDIPAYVESLIIQRFYEINGCLPKWNKEI